jgi:hypothetical protein
VLSISEARAQPRLVARVAAAAGEHVGGAHAASFEERGGVDEVVQTLERGERGDGDEDGLTGVGDAESLVQRGARRQAIARRLRRDAVVHHHAATAERRVDGGLERARHEHDAIREDLRRRPQAAPEPQRGPAQVQHRGAPRQLGGRPGDEDAARGVAVDHLEPLVANQAHERARVGRCSRASIAACCQRDIASTRLLNKSNDGGAATMRVGTPAAR